MKRFTPIMYIVILAIMFVLVPTIVVTVFWVLVGKGIVISKGIITIIINAACFESIILYPIALYMNRESASVVLTENTIENYMNDKTLNFGWIEEIVNIKSIKITNREECQKYYKDCKARRVFLIDFGDGNVKYIALTWFTKKQSERILQTIKERLTAIKQYKN